MDNNVHGHHHKHGKSEMFTKAALDSAHVGKGKYDNEKTAKALEHVAAAVRAGNVELITRRIGGLSEASDGSGKPAIGIYQEYKFLHGIPSETIDLD